MKTKTVYEVLIDTDAQGPAGDGTQIRRFFSKASAERCARENTCYGQPCTVGTFDAPKRLYDRWVIGV
jgi:hypothetical protein